MTCATTPARPTSPGVAAHALPCPTCSLGLHHCHGLVVEHDDGAWTCLDGCDGPLAVHDVVEPCADVGLGCCGEVPVGGIGIGAAGHPEERAWAA